MNKKLYICLSAFLFAVTANLIAMEPLRESMLNEFDTAALSIESIGDYAKAIVRYKEICEARTQYICESFAQEECDELQCFILAALSNELQKPHDQINFIGYVEIPISLDIGFHKIVDRESGRTPLHVAASVGHLRTVQALLGAGADIDAVADEGSTPLNLASQNGHLTTVIELLKYDADVDIADDNGATPLHYAATGEMENDLAITQALVDANADLYAQDNNQRTPLDVAESSENFSIALTLLQAGQSKKRIRYQ